MSRAIAQAGTVRIGKNGLASLSPDLYLGSKLLLLGYDQKTKKLRFQLNDADGLSLYKSAPGSKSGAVSLMAVLKMFGLQKEVGGTFVAVVDKEVLEIDFKRRVIRWHDQKR